MRGGQEGMRSFMLIDWWFNVFGRVVKRGPSAVNACRSVSKIGEGLRRCFKNRSETSGFDSENMEDRAEMQWSYRPLARDA